MRDRSILAQPRRGLIYDLLAPPLILATPFVSFVNHNDYSLGAAEIWISLAGLIAAGVLCGLIMAIGGAWLRIVMTAGLVILFVDLQFNWLDVQPRLRIPVFAIGVVLLCWVVRDHLSRIAASVFVMMLVAALALPGPSGDRTVTNSDGESNSRASSRSAPPVLVHLIFDGFIGVEGIPSDLANGRAVKDQLQSFFHSNGFYLFGGAYSRFDLTKYAIPSTLSYGSVSASDTVESVRRVRDNKYFQEMHERGYDIHVYQTEFMDFCTGYEPQVVSCHTFINNGIKPLQRLRLRPTVKAEISVKIFSRTSVILGILDRNYGRLRRSARVHGYDLPPSVFGRYSLAPDRALQVLDIIADDVARAPAGQMFFAHLLVPHRPFILDGACQLRDPSTWDVQSDDDERALNLPKARAEQYARYLQQISCIQTKLQQMFDAWRRSGVYGRMKIVVHGDHGSRIGLHVPDVSNKDRMLISDYTDSFSTLFAVMAPGQEATYDTRLVAIQDLLIPVAHELSLDQLPVVETEAYVLLENGDGMLRQPMPQFAGLR